MSKAAPVSHYDAIMKDPAVQQKEDELKAQKIKRVAICLIALGITLLAATAIIGYKFHIYRPFTENSYHYLGLAIIGLGGGSIGSLLIYKGIMAPKEAKIKEFEDMINTASEAPLINRIIAALNKKPNILNEGVTIGYLNKLLGTITFDNENDANTVAQNLEQNFAFILSVIPLPNNEYKIKIIALFNPKIHETAKFSSSDSRVEQFDQYFCNLRGSNSTCLIAADKLYPDLIKNRIITIAHLNELLAVAPDEKREEAVKDSKQLEAHFKLETRIEAVGKKFKVVFTGKPKPNTTSTNKQ